MARVLNKFNLHKNPYVRADGINPEGFPSFQRSDEEAYLQVLLTNTLTGTFYAQESQLLQESLALHASMTQRDPAFAARALVYARNAGMMRMQPIVGLAYLAKADHTLFHRVFGRVILTPGDLTDFVEIVRGDVVPGGMGRCDQDGGQRLAERPERISRHQVRDRRPGLQPARCAARDASQAR